MLQKIVLAAEYLVYCDSSRPIHLKNFKFSVSVFVVSLSEPIPLHQHFISNVLTLKRNIQSPRSYLIPLILIMRSNRSTESYGLRTQGYLLEFCGNLRGL